ncbi:hypothetical protein [uncultured Flavobacterium sp.]|uniref:hypothetical protein n=1 Tax=uncultured Flavobacterium sp. TaxID=165435 RepID=UPI0030CA3E55
MLTLQKINQNTLFNNLTFSENGLTLTHKNKSKREISFDDVEQIYIKKHKLHPVLECMGIASPFVLVYMAIQYVPFAFEILIALITILSFYKSIFNFKWYRLCVRLKDGTTYRKKIPLHLKTESITILDKIRTNYLYYKSRPFAAAS